MPNLNLEDLFHESGPKGMLEYLYSRLEARDLSGEEALALLGAIHQQLSHAEIKDPALFRSYAAFIEQLRVEMPEIHDYIISSQAPRGTGALRAAGTVEDAEFVDGGPAETGPSGPVHSGGFDDSVKEPEAGPGEELDKESEAEPEEEQAGAPQTYEGPEKGEAAEETSRSDAEEHDPVEQEAHEVDKRGEESPEPEPEEQEEGPEKGTDEVQPEVDEGQAEEAPAGGPDQAESAEPSVEGGGDAEGGDEGSEEAGADEAPEWPEPQESEGEETEAGVDGEMPGIE
jgi:hypothetical protein